MVDDTTKPSTEEIVEKHEEAQPPPVTGVAGGDGGWGGWGFSAFSYISDIQKAATTAAEEISRNVRIILTPIFSFYFCIYNVAASFYLLDLAVEIYFVLMECIIPVSNVGSFLDLVYYISFRYLGDVIELWVISSSFLTSSKLWKNQILLALPSDLGIRLFLCFGPSLSVTGT